MYIHVPVTYSHVQSCGRKAEEVVCCFVLQTDVFLVEGLDVGCPAYLKISLQGADPQAPPAWHVSHIICTVLEGEGDVQGDRHYFSAERWVVQEVHNQQLLQQLRALPSSGCQLCWQHNIKHV